MCKNVVDFSTLTLEECRALILAAERRTREIWRTMAPPADLDVRAITIEAKRRQSEMQMDEERKQMRNFKESLRMNN